MPVAGRSELQTSQQEMMAEPICRDLCAPHRWLVVWVGGNTVKREMTSIHLYSERPTEEDTCMGVGILGSDDSGNPGETR